MNSNYRAEYIARINRVIDYIQNNLDSQLDLDKLANIAHFSKFHFHRIFSAMVGETLNSFVKRLRIEKSATMLIVNKNTSITEIAFECGFSGSAQFSRAFKEHFGMSATRYRTIGKNQSKNSQQKSNIGNVDSNGRKADKQKSTYFDDVNSKNKRGIDMKVEVKKLDDMTVAYVRHIGPYAGDSDLFGKLFEKLYKWAGPRELLNFPETKTMSIYYDDPNVTDESKLRVDVGLTVPADTKVTGEIGKVIIEGGKYAIARFELKDNEYAEAWKKFMSEWLPDSGFVPDHKPCFEMYMNDPKQHPEGKCIVDICVPVKPM